MSKANAVNRMDQWQRLKPQAIVHFIIKIVMRAIKEAMQVFLPLIVVYAAAGERRWSIIAMIGIGLVALLLIGAFLSYLKFRFRISNDSVLIQSGVLKRKRLSLGFDKIQNIALSEPLYFRPFGLVVMQIESAGSSSEEVTLGGVPRTYAEEIRSLVLQHKVPQNDHLNIESNESKTNQTDASNQQQHLLHLPIGELIRFGLTNNSIWIFAGIGAGAMSQFEWGGVYYFKSFGELIETVAGNNPFPVLILTILGVIIAVVSLLLLLSAIGAIIIHYDFKLSQLGTRLHISKGLFEKKESSLLIPKLQSIQFKQSWPAKILKRYHVHLTQISFSKSGTAARKSGSNFMIPSAKADFITEFSARLYPNFDWRSLKLNAISRLFVWKNLLWFVLPIALIPTTFITYHLGLPYGLIPLMAPLIAYVILRRVHLMYGYATDGKHGIVKSGFLGHSLKLFPFYKVQTVHVTQSPGQRRAMVANLNIKLAGSTITIPFMGIEDANQWRDKILFEVETNKLSWM